MCGRCTYFDKADAVGDAALARVTEGCIKAGIRHADDDIRLHGMLEREERACALARDMDAAAVDDGVRAGEVDELEDAKLLRRFAAVARVGANAGRVDDNDLTRADVALKLGADGVERAGFRREDNRAVLQMPHAEGTEAVGVARGNELRRRGEDEGIRALDAVHRSGDSLFDGAAVESLLHDDVGDDLAVGRGLEDGAATFKLLPQLAGIRQIAVVRERHTALEVVH